MKIQHSTSKGWRSCVVRQRLGRWALNVECSIFLFFCVIVFGATTDGTNGLAFLPPPAVLETSRDFYNAGTQKFRAGKLNDAEAMFQASLAKQDERTEPLALYNLGHVRFAQ